jgi:hypothetical protein
MIYREHLRQYVIRPTLQQIGMWSLAAENLLLGTAAHESRMGHYLVQIGGGPALGIYQVEPKTHDDIWQHFLKSRPAIADRISSLTPFIDAEQMIANMAYATAMARMVYYRRPEPLPAADDLPGMARYWKKFYNTPLGAGTTKQFIDSYMLYAQ